MLCCCNCKYEPDWDFQSVTMVMNHTVSTGWCKFDEDYEVPKCFAKSRVCVVVPDNPEKEVRFGVTKQGSIIYMKDCGGWRPSDSYLEMPDLKSLEDEYAGM